MKATTGTLFMAIMKIIMSFGRIGLTTALVTISFYSSSISALTNLASDRTLKQTSVEVVNQLKLNHYRYLTLDNEFSSKLFDKYLSQLDPSKSYFLQSDINDFEGNRYLIDNALNRGDLTLAFDMFNRFQQRLETRLEWLLEYTEQDISRFDFNLDEVLEVDRENATWAQKNSKLDDYWRKRLKHSALNLKLSDKDASEIMPLLHSRYKNQLKRLQQTNSDDVFQLFINVLAKSYDPHTEYLAPRRSENFNINMRLSLEGIGAVLQTDQEYTKVVRLIANGPADLTKDLHPADRIIGVAQDEGGEMVDVIGWRLEDVVDLIRGRKDTLVRLEVTSSDNKTDEKPREVRIVRNKVLLEDQAAQKKVIEFPQGDKTYKLGVITIPAFYFDYEAFQNGDSDYKSTTRDVARILDELKTEHVDGVIIDLRNNGGGFLNEANSLVGLFIPTGATVQIKNARGRVQTLKDTDPGIAYNGPLAVMVNRLSASASEIFAGAIQDYQRGIIIGGQTFGKGTVQTVIPLKRGQLKITQQKFYRISGESTQHQGVIPDITLPPIIDLKEIGEDALDDALPWDTIRPVLHKKNSDVSPYFARLSKQHDKRVLTDPDYQYRLKQIKRAEENRNKTTVPLSVDQRLKEQEEFKNWQLEQLNIKRKAKGEAVLVNLDDLDEEKEADRVDPYLLEGGHILADFIALHSKNNVAQN